MDDSIATGQKFDLFSNGYDDDDDDDEFQGYEVVNNIAVIPVKGNLTTNETWLTKLFGLSTYEGISRMLMHASENSEVSRIVMDTDTPGGSSVGVDELGLLIEKIDQESKPVHGYTSGAANSAGYWIISSCRDVTCTKMSNLGSIGVVTIHQEISKMLKDQGVEVTVFRDGKFKAKPNQYEKLDKETKEMVNGSLKLLGNFFLDWVADQRGFDRSTVRADVGEGRVFFGEQAVEKGLADRIMFFEDFMHKLYLLDSIETDQPNLSRMVSMDSGSKHEIQLNMQEVMSTETIENILIPAIESHMNKADSVLINTNKPKEDTTMSAANAKDTAGNTAGKKIQTAQGEMTLEQVQASIEMGTLKLTEELKLAMAALQSPEDSATEEDGNSENTDTEGDGNSADMSSEPGSESETNNEGGDPVVAHVQGQLTEQTETNAKLRLELETVKAKLETQSSTVEALSSIAKVSCEKMSLVIGGGSIDLSSMDTASLLSHHAKLAEKLTETFKVGGVAAVESEKEHAEGTKSRSMSAPLNTVSFNTK